MTDYDDFRQLSANGSAKEPTSTPAKPKKLEKQDILELKNFFLKIQNLKLQGDRLQEDTKKCHQMIGELQENLRKKRDELSEKYGVDLTKCQVAADGTIIPGIPQQV